MSQEVYQPYINNPGEQVKTKRSIFDLSCDFLGTFESGKLIPVMWQEMVPGDTTQVNMNTLIRMLTPVVPVMDSAILDIYLFKVPMRICMNPQNVDDKTFQRVMGENINGAGAVSSESEIPSFTSAEFTRNEFKGFIGNYLGLPYYDTSSNKVIDPNLKISCVPFYAYQGIWNEFFRDEQTMIPRRNTARVICENYPYPVCKFHDVFTDATVRPQLHDPVSLSLAGNAPVYGIGELDTATLTGVWKNAQATSFGDVRTQTGSTNAVKGGAAPSDSLYYSLVGFSQDSQVGSADLSSVTSVDINDLRYSIALQSLYEAMNRGGSRYREYLYTVYDTVSEDKTLQIPQYLGGVSIPLEIDTVLQTSSTDQTSALGDTGAFSATSLFDKNLTLVSTSEHCILMAVACVRTHQHYFQGLAKKFSHLKQTDFYNPLFEGIGDQPIMTSELYAVQDPGASVHPSDTVFGYGPAWYEYRSGKQDSVLTGGFNPDEGDLILAKWTYAEPFTAAPVLNNTFKTQTTTAIGKTLVDEETDSQFLLNIHFDIKTARNMRVSTIPSKLLGTL